MDTEAEIAQLKAKLKATEAVHAAVIAALLSIVFRNTSPEDFFRSVRESITTSATGGSDPAARENLTLLSEQYIDDAIHLLQHVMKSMDRSS